jgi:CheY-like chemotaxis protein
MKILKRILLAEDDENDVDLTLSALRERNLANIVDVVRDGDEALQYLRRQGAYAARPAENPVVVLLDLKMPKVDGLEVLKQIREEPKLALLPVVILTSSREERDLLRSYRTGVNAYVVKPLEFEAFAEAIRQLGVFWALLNEPPPGTDGPAQ